MGEAAEILTRQNVLVQRLASGHERKFEKFLREMDRALRQRLAGDALTTFSRSRLETLLAAVGAMLDGVLGRFTRQLVIDLVEFAEHEAGVAARAFEAVIPAPA